jgi:c-di-GMP-related signal transduction protein
LLGERNVRRWVSLIAVSCVADSKPTAVVRLPLVRTRFCELLGSSAGLAESANDLFLLGLLSAVDAISDMTIPDVLDEITVSKVIRDALLGKSNALQEVFELVVQYEKGRWDQMVKWAARSGIDEARIVPLYSESVDWAQQVLSGSTAQGLDPA